jgi:hypothetical protein
LRGIRWGATICLLTTFGRQSSCAVTKDTFGLMSAVRSKCYALSMGTSMDLSLGFEVALVVSMIYGRGYLAWLILSHCICLRYCSRHNCFKRNIQGH